MVDEEEAGGGGVCSHLISGLAVGSWQWRASNTQQYAAMSSNQAPLAEISGGPASKLSPR